LVIDVRRDDENAVLPRRRLQVRILDFDRVLGRLQQEHRNQCDEGNQHGVGNRGRLLRESCRGGKFIPGIGFWAMRRAATILIALTVVVSAHASSLFDKLGESSDLLKAGKYAEALKLDDYVIHEMGEHYVSGDATTQFFCIAIVHKALACAGLGRREDALWY